jgi:DNA alkylation repair enzyme
LAKNVKTGRPELNAKQFIERLEAHRSAVELKKYHRYFTFDESPTAKGDRFIGVRMGQVFALAKEFIEMPPSEIEKLLESPIHEVRASSKDTWERRTAIVATLYFIGKDEVEDTFKIAELLLKEKQDLVHKGMGWALRYAGQKNRQKLISFLDRHAPIMPRIALRYAIEHLDKKQRDYYLGMKKIQSRNGKAAASRA